MTQKIQHWFKITGALVVVAAMGFCQFHKPPIVIPKEMWTIISAILTYIFIGMFPQVKAEMPAYGEIVKGAITVVILAMISLSVYIGLEVGKEWWSIAGVAVAFMYGSGGN